MATDVSRPNSGEFVHVAASAAAAAIINDTIDVRSDLKIVDAFISVPIGTTWSLKMQLPGSGALVTLAGEKSTATSYNYAVASGISAPTGAQITFLTDAVVGDKKYDIYFEGA